MSKVLKRKMWKIITICPESFKTDIIPTNFYPQLTILNLEL